jgi:hypothetical protein
LHREWFAAIAAKTKRMEYRSRTTYWKTRLENRKYDAIQFRNGNATNAPDQKRRQKCLCHPVEENYKNQTLVE